jgi:hypothetical protein
MLFSCCKRVSIIEEEEERRLPHDKCAGSFIFRNTKYNLSKGAIYYCGNIDDSLYNTDIILYSDSIELDKTIPTPNGNGHIIYFETITDSQTGIKEGIYNYSDSLKYFCLKNGEIEINLCSSTNTSEFFLKITSPSTIEISLKSGILSCNFNLTTLNGESLIGCYYGEINKTYY